ncbi:MAG: hypothetical protein B6244_11905 [Candidatus Cloacimonetes bacterium 4572_55]|nr:MAG: hypothetical protein B6244_11905 [Candidatus Cloacimonetes bacterium 4572_55]
MQSRDQEISFMESVAPVMRLMASTLGIIAIVIGLIYAMRIFNTVYQAMVNPENFTSIFDQWALVIGGDKLDLKLIGDAYPMSRIFTIFILGGGTFILSWLALGIMIGGAKIVSWTSGDREAIKRILAYTFGGDSVEHETKELRN